MNEKQRRAKRKAAAIARSKLIDQIISGEIKHCTDHSLIVAVQTRMFRRSDQARRRHAIEWDRQVFYGPRK